MRGEEKENRKAMVIKLLMDSKRLGDNYTTKLRWLSCLARQKEKILRPDNEFKIQNRNGGAAWLEREKKDATARHSNQHNQDGGVSTRRDKKDLYKNIGK